MSRCAFYQQDFTGVCIHLHVCFKAVYGGLNWYLRFPAGKFYLHSSQPVLLLCVWPPSHEK